MGGGFDLDGSGDATEFYAGGGVDGVALSVVGELVDSDDPLLEIAWGQAPKEPDSASRVLVVRDGVDPSTSGFSDP